MDDLLLPGCGPCDADPCAPAPTCPPAVVVQPGALAEVGTSNLYVTIENVTCDYGDQISQLAQLTCAEEQPACSLGEALLAEANAYVTAALSRCYVLPLTNEVTGEVLFPTAPIDPNTLVKGSLAHTVYWSYRRWVGVVARFWLFRDARRIDESRPAPYVMFEKQAEELKERLDGCKDCGCTLLPGLRKVGRSGAAIAVAGRAASPLPVYGNAQLARDVWRARMDARWRRIGGGYGY